MLDLLLLDGKHCLWRAADAFKDLYIQEGDKRHGTGAIYGFLNIAVKAHKVHGGTVVVAWDDWNSGPAARVATFPAYKAKKHGPAEEGSEHDLFLKDMARQQVQLRSFLPLLGIAQVWAPRWEADDVLGALAAKFGKNGTKVGILSGDQDLIQVVTEDVCLIRPRDKGTFKIETPETILEERGIQPKQIIDFKALVGDAGDNIPGVPGIGEKTATDLIKEHGGWQEAIEWAKAQGESLSPKRLMHLVKCQCKSPCEISHEESAKLSAKLATLNPSPTMKWISTAQDRNRATRMMLLLGFKSLLHADRLQELMTMGSGAI